MTSDDELMPLVRPTVERVPDLVFIEYQGQVAGAGFFAALLGAALLAVPVRGLRELGLDLVVIGFPFSVVLAVVAKSEFQEGLLLIGWRRWVTRVALAVPSLAAYRLGAPVERWAGVAQSPWEVWSYTGMIVACAFFLPELFNAEGSQIRYAPEWNDSVRPLPWYDQRVTYLRRRLRRLAWAPWKAEAERQARGSLGYLLMARFRHPDGGHLVDVAEAYGNFARVVTITPDGSPDAVTVRYELQQAMSAFQMADASDPDFAAAVTTMREVVDGWSDRMRERDKLYAWATLARLESGRYILAVRDGGVLPPNAEADMYRLFDRIEASAPPLSGGVHPEWLAVYMLTPIGQYYVVRGSVGLRHEIGMRSEAQRLADLDHGIAVLEGVMARKTGLASYPKGVVLAYLALGRVQRYWLRFDRADGEVELDRASRELLAALRDPLLTGANPALNLVAELGVAIASAGRLVDARLARGEWAAALRVGFPALDATRILFESALFDANVQQAASYWQGLHDSIAYAMFRGPRGGRPDPWAVVSMIEWGRAVRLSTGLAGSNAAAVIPPSVAAEDKAAWIELVKRAKQIERITYTRGATSTFLLAGRKRDERLVIKRQMKELAQRMAADVARARAEQAASGDASLAAFLGGETRKRIAAAAADTTLCYLVHLSVSSGDDDASLPGLAVLVEPRHGSDDEEPNVRVIELPEMHGAAVTEWTRRWREHSEAARVRDMTLAHPDGPGLGALAVDDLLGDLGSSVLQPVLDAAGHPDRLVLLPDAVLGLLPWHAALVTEAGGTIPRPACLSTVISYAPSAEVLNLCRQAVRRSGGGLGDGSAVFPREFLGVAAPKHHLPEAEPEVVTCARHFEHAEVLSEAGVRPTLARVLRALDEPPRGSRVVHFACHGLVDNLNPRYSSLILDTPEPGDDAALLNEFTVELDLAAVVIDKLTIADLWSAELAGTRLAVLSACRSGDAADDLPGEFTSLAGGVPGVVSTLARVDDLAARLVACRFYYEWRVRPGDPAAALAAAQSWLALGSPDEVVWWAERYADWQDGDADKVRHMNHAAAWAPFCFTGA